MALGQPAQRNGGFSLLELLAVLAILVAVAGFIVPSMTGLTRSGKGQQGGAAVMSAFDQARAFALANATDCYLVFADAGASWPEDYRGRAFAIFQETYAPASQNYLRLPVTSWTLLPEGLCFSPDDDTVFGATRDTFYSKPAGGDLSLPYVKFNAVGSIEKPAETGHLKLRVVNGRLLTSGVQSTGPKDSSPPFEVRLFALTGKAQRIQPGDTTQ